MAVMNRDGRWLAKILKSPTLVNCRHSTGMTPLFAACYALWHDGAKALLEAGAEPLPGFEGLKAARLDWLEAPVVWMRAARNFERIAGLLIRETERKARISSAAG
jgi:hypothetical protein